MGQSLAIGSAREITVDGTEWRVTERDSRETPGALGTRCLTFDSYHTVRRVWSYPTDWRQLSGDELYNVSWRK